MERISEVLPTLEKELWQSRSKGWRGRFADAGKGTVAKPAGARLLPPRSLADAGKGTVAKRRGPSCRTGRRLADAGKGTVAKPRRRRTPYIRRLADAGKGTVAKHAGVYERLDGVLPTLEKELWQSLGDRREYWITVLPTLEKELWQSCILA